LCKKKLLTLHNYDDDVGPLKWRKMIVEHIVVRQPQFFLIILSVCGGLLHPMYMKNADFEEQEHEGVRESYRSGGGDERRM
jgi:hypothetical protein